MEDLLLLLLLEQVMLLGDLHLGVLLLLLLLEDELLLPVHGYGFADDHTAAGGESAAAALRETAAEIFLLAELLFFLERPELCGRHGLAVAQLDDAGGVVVRLWGGLLRLLLLNLLGWLRGLLQHLGRLQLLGLHRRLLLGGGWLLLVGLIGHLGLLGGGRLGSIWGSFRDDRGLNAVLKVFQIVRGVAGRFLGSGGNGGCGLLGINGLLLRLGLLGLLRLRWWLLLGLLRDRCQLGWLSGCGGG